MLIFLKDNVNGKERKNLKTSRQNRFPTTAKQKNLKKGQEHRRLCINPAARQKETQEIALHHDIVRFHRQIAALHLGVVSLHLGIVTGPKAVQVVCFKEVRLKYLKKGKKIKLAMMK